MVANLCFLVFYPKVRHVRPSTISVVFPVNTAKTNLQKKSRFNMVAGPFAILD